MTTRKGRRARQKRQKARSQLGPWRMPRGKKTLVEAARWWANIEVQDRYQRWHFAKFHRYPADLLGATLSIFAEVNPFLEMLTFRPAP